jgi:serine protease Do
LPKPGGAIVSPVEPDSPADRAGLRAGDVIVEYNDKPVQDAEHLTAMVVNTAPERVSVAFYRNGQRQTASVTIARLELEGGIQPDIRARGGADSLGIRIAAPCGTSAPKRCLQRSQVPREVFEDAPRRGPIAFRDAVKRSGNR